jgi:hypothetical protein
MVSFQTSLYAQQQCTAKGQLKAEYKITVQHNLQNMNNNTKDTTLVLWRKNNAVAHQYPSTKITEMWQKVNDRLIKPIRFFNAHNRAIEYQPGETVHGKRETDWSYRNQLISDVLLKSMQKVKSYGKDCEQVIQLIQKSNKGELLIEWMPQLKLIKSFQFKGQQRQEDWQLVALDTQSAKTENYFNQLYMYQTIDYADIGDAHTDKFLNEMVTLGFVEASASGYIDSEVNKKLHRQ